MQKGGLVFYVDLELDSIIEAALLEKASDIHFESVVNGVLVQFRVDGLLTLYKNIAAEYAEQVINRIKVESGLDIGEKRIPQDGRWDWKKSDRFVQMRISTMPTIYGESVVCRLMGDVCNYKSLEELGMDAELITCIDKILQRPYGLFLITGPTGSGKTSTLYALLRRLELSMYKLICLEDPVEAHIEHARQIQINEKVGVTFATGLRAVLRQDPDIIMVGEIRDTETASLAIQAALTGHKVFSTIHTNSSEAVVERLIDMGVAPYLIEATLIGAMAQRLVRKYVPTIESYQGRVGVYELLSIPSDTTHWIQSIPEHLITSLADSAKILVERKVTTQEEVKRHGIFI